MLVSFKSLYISYFKVHEENVASGKQIFPKRVTLTARVGKYRMNRYYSIKQYIKIQSKVSYEKLKGTHLGIQDEEDTFCRGTRKL